MSPIGLYFDLEFRAVAEQQDNVPFNSGSVKVYRRCQQAIHFCPWCGKDLKRYYEKQQDGLTIVESDLSPLESQSSEGLSWSINGEGE